MKKGRIIFLNGVTSAGKTSIVEALQERDDIFFYVVANDLFQEMVKNKYLRENYWKYLSDIIIMMYHTAKLFSDHGRNVLIDGILVERPEITPHYEYLQSGRMRRCYCQGTFYLKICSYGVFIYLGLMKYVNQYFERG